MKIIIAKTHEQFIQACHQRNLSTKLTPHITTSEQVLKISGAVEPIFIGDFWNLAGYNDIERALKARGIKIRNQYVRKVDSKWGETSD